MDIRIFEVLDFLNKNGGVGNKLDISPIINKFYPVEENIQMYVYTKESGNIMRFIEALSPFITNNNEYSINAHNSFPKQFLTPFYVSINNEGIKELDNEHQKHQSKVLNNSAIDANNSLIATNNAVQETNKRMLEHAEEQSKFVQTQLGYTKQQTVFTSQQVGLVQRQNTLYKFTLILTAVNIGVGLGVLIATLNSNADKELISIQRSQLLSKEKEIQQLQLLKSDTVHYVLHYPQQKSNLKTK
jgi:hypothetical protein